MEESWLGKSAYKTLCCQWWWEAIYHEAITYCKNYAECAIVSETGQTQRPPLHPIPVQRAFQILGVDIMELPITMRGNYYLIVFQNILIKWSFVFSFPDQKAIRIVQSLAEEIVPVLGVPDALLSDRGTNLLQRITHSVTA
jgi:hypothetical protein